MARQDRYIRKVDRKPAKDTSGELVTESISIASSTIIIPSGVDTPSITSQVIGRSAATPFINVTLTWSHPDGEIPSDYLVSYAESSDFTANEFTRVAYGTSIVLNLKPTTDYWFRVAARFSQVVSPWSESTTVTTIADTQIPQDVSSIAAVYDRDNLIVTWDEPADEAYKDAEIKIWDADHTVVYETVYIRGGSYVWTAEKNLQRTSNAGLTSVSIDVTSRSWSNTLGNTVNTTANQAVPSTPSNVAHTWTGDTGIAPAFITFTWDAVTSASLYTITIDSITKTVATPRYEYSFAENVTDHANSPDPSLAFSIVASNRLNQNSTAYTDTAVNVRPPSSAISLSATGTLGGIGAIVSVSDKVQDFSHYEWVLKRGTDVLATYNSPETVMIFELSEPGTYSVEVKIVDVFDQKSDAVIQSDITIDVLTIEQLRAETEYSDSESTSPSILNGLKDGILNVSVVSYAGDNTWRWILAKRPLLDRYKTITYVAGGLGDDQIYFGLSSDAGTTYRWFAGPLTLTGSTGKYTTLTEYATELLAKTNAYTIDGSTSRYDLPAIIEARQILVGHRSTAAYSVTEYYPRRMVEGDDIRAESITGDNVQASTLSGTHIIGTTLSAVKTSTGTLTVDSGGYIRSGQTAYDTGTGFYIGNDSGTTKFSIGVSTGTKMLWDGTNLSFRSGTSNQRIQIDNDGISSYNSSNTLQLQIRSSDGVLVAGGGNVYLNSTGFKIIMNTTWSRGGIESSRAFVLKDNNNTGNVFLISGADLAAYNYADMWVPSTVSKYGQLNLIADSTNSSGGGAQMELIGKTSLLTSEAWFLAGNVELLCWDGGIVELGTIQGTTNAVVNIYGTTNNKGGLNVGTATGALTGEVRASSHILTGGNFYPGNQGSWCFYHGGGAWTATNANFMAGGKLAPDNQQTYYFGKTTSVNGLNVNGSFGVNGAQASTEALRITGLGNTNGTYGLVIKNSAGTNVLYTLDDQGVVLVGNVGFYNTAPVAKQTVSGSRGGNAALTSLLTALASLGLITNSTT